MHKQPGRVTASTSAVSVVVFTAWGVVERIQSGRHGEECIRCPRTLNGFAWKIERVFAAYIITIVRRLGKRADRRGAGTWTYLFYRAVDWMGATIDFWLSVTRAAVAVRCSSGAPCRLPRISVPRVINLERQPFLSEGSGGTKAGVEVGAADAADEPVPA
jgi:hypothetical protein